MARPSPYPAELRRRAVRMVAEVRPDYETEWAAMKAVASKLGIGTAETVRQWVRRDQIDSGSRPGTTTEESAQAPHLLTIPGCGVLGAAVIIGETADAARFASKAAFARFNGTAPIPVRSGNRVRVRLNRGGATPSWPKRYPAI